MACKKLTNVSLSELYKRVPQNQMQYFLRFRDKHAEYNKLVNRFPEQLPKIDWDYYRTNVRTEYVNMVNEFEKKYEELNKVFDGRYELDNTSYYKELDTLKCEVKVDVERYIADSNKRIRVYEAEIARIRSMLPYDEMTCQDFVEQRPERAHLLGVTKPSFWPHIPDEQTPGSANPMYGHDDDEVEEDAKKVKKSKDEDAKVAAPAKGGKTAPKS